MSYKNLISIKGLPVLQNKVFSTESDAISSAIGDVVLAQNMETGLVHNIAFNQDLVVYDVDYQNEQACSQFFIQHLLEVADIIGRHFYGKSIIEVGCGKGYFLEYLLQLGYQITGVDPAYEGTNNHVIKACFESRLGLSADGIVLRHVLEHVLDPIGFMIEIAKANGNKGNIYIEAPCLDWICNNKAWYDVYYEHINYFRLSDIKRMFGVVLESGHLFGGQYMYIVADLSSLRTPYLLDRIEFPKDFFNSVKKSISIASKSKHNVIWGGASKGVTFAVHMKRAGVVFDMVIDANPVKWDKYIAVSGLRIMPPDKALSAMEIGTNIFIANPNYLNEILDFAGSQFNYRMI